MKAVIFGAGGHAQVVADILKLMGVKVEAFVVSSGDQEILRGIPIIDEELFYSTPAALCGLVGIGDNFRRERVALEVRKRLPAFKFLTAVHPRAVVSEWAEIGEGTAVMANAVINPGTFVGSHCIVNTSASLDHDCSLGQASSVAPNATLGGGVKIGLRAAVSIGAIVMPRIEIGQDAVLGAGALATSSIPSLTIAYGTPARVIRPRKLGEEYLS